MTPDEYQEKAAHYIGDKTTFDCDLMFSEGAVGLAEETGEVAAIINHYLYRGERYTLDTEAHLAEELGDVFWYACEIATAAGLSLSDIMETNIQKLEKRYPNGFMKGGPK